MLLIFASPPRLTEVHLATEPGGHPGWTKEILRKWGGGGDDHHPGQAMKEDGRLPVTDREKAEAFSKTYTHGR